MKKTYNVGQSYLPAEFKHKELFLTMRHNLNLQYRYENAVSVYNMYVTEKDGMYRVEVISRKNNGKHERVNSMVAVVTELDEMVRRHC